MLVKLSNLQVKAETLKRKKAIGVLFDQQESGLTQLNRQIYFRDHSIQQFPFSKKQDLMWTKDGDIIEYYRIL